MHNTIETNNNLFEIHNTMAKHTKIKKTNEEVNKPYIFM